MFEALYAMDLQINNSEQLLWSDVLHHSWTAENSHDPWDYSSAVRSMVIVGWVVIELVSGRLSGCQHLGYSYRKKMDSHLLGRGMTAIDWSSGWGKELADLIAERIDIVHLSGTKGIRDFFYKSGSHSTYLNRAKSVLNGISKHLGSHESWWETTQYEDYKSSRSSAHASYVMAGYEETTGHEIGYVMGGKSFVYGQVPGETSREKYAEMLLLLKGPVTRTFIRSRGVEILHEEFFSRGV